MGLALTTAATGSRLFGPIMLNTGHIGPRGLAYRDLNHDGNVDMVSANTSSPNNTVAVQLGNGDGTFDPVVNFVTNVPFLMRNVAIGDINGDGHQDIVVPAGNAEPVVSVLLGNGDGTFAAGVVYPMGASHTGEIVVRDFNNDGRADVVGATGAMGVIMVRLGQADGTLGAASSYAAGGSTGEITAGDLNGDGWLDVVTTIGIGIQFRGVAVLLGNGAGGFSLLATFSSAPLDVGASGVTLADFNNDGFLDLATSHATPSNVVAVRLGTGDGFFGPQSTFGTGGDGTPNTIAAGDVNGDGNIDVAISNHNFGAHTNGILLGLGNGAFSFVTLVATAGAAGYISLADLNNDGVADLSLAESGTVNAVSVRLSLATATNVQLLDGAGTVLATGAIANNLRSVLTYTASSAGTYYACDRHGHS